MKKKITKIWGVGLVLVLVASMLLAAAPASAAELAWGTESIPSTTGKVLQPGDITDLAVAADGTTIYAASGVFRTATLGKDGSNTATWSNAQKVSGTTSALLTHVGANRAYVYFTPPTGITLAKFVAAPTTYSFNYFPNTRDVGPQLELTFTDPANALNYAEITIEAALYDYLVADYSGQWNLKTLAASSLTLFYGDYGGSQFAYTAPSAALSGVAAAIAASTNGPAAAVVNTWEMTKVLVDFGWGGSVTKTSYIDDVTIAGTTYNLEGTHGSTATGYALSGNLYKSTNAGVTWSGLTNPTGAADVQLVAVAPDNANIVAVVADVNEVYVSTNGGSTWGDLGVPSPTGSVAATLNDLAISATDAGTNYTAVAGVTTDTLADIWYFNVGAAAPAWTSGRLKDTVGFTAGTKGLAVAFSPNFVSDKVMVAVTASATAVSYQMYSTSTTKWNSEAGFSGYSVNIQNGITDIANATAASISLSPEYLGSDDTLRIAFVGITAAAADGGVYRLKDVTDKAIDVGANIHSIAFDGTNLVAGRTADNVVRRSTDPLATTPTFGSAASLKRPGLETNTNVVVAWNGADVVAGTSGTGSAFAISRDDGVSFNDVSLVDTAGTTLGNTDDVAVSADGSKVYMLTRDANSVSLWRFASSWERVLAITSATGYIVRIAPEDADAVYVAKTGAKTIYYSQAGGNTKWFTRTAKYNIADMAVESASVAYIGVSGEATVSKTTNNGFTWGTSKAVGFSGIVHSLTSLGVDKLVAGSTLGYVAYSADGNANWTNILKQLTYAGVTHVTASGLATDDYIYAATTLGTKAERWQIGTSTAWKDLGATTANATGIALVGGVLYVQAWDGASSTTLRTITPTSAEPSAGMWSTMTTTADFTRTPSALRTSTGSTKLWAVDSTAPAVYSFLDTLATAAPALSSPATEYTLEMNPVSGKSFAQPFTWTRPSKATIYDLQAALDSGFTQKVWTPTTASTTLTDISEVADADTFMPNKTYYWRVRVNVAGPVQSPWSEVRTFKVAALVVKPPVEVKTYPPPVITIPPVPPPPQITITPPQIVLPPPPAVPEIVIPAAPTPPAPITPAFIWAIIIIGAILVIALIVLIVRTRRPV